ncbi:hypothetical protein AB1Y20_019842 [Prymnesium parvum]|uniref:DNA mismatch repair proteins mutS family domain-containing protein n=1 Tax=Prymnesium parvum TaxID=97485 RepID=A0AB34JVH7_PRYPA
MLLHLGAVAFCRPARPLTLRACIPHMPRASLMTLALEPAEKPSRAAALDEAAPRETHEGCDISQLVHAGPYWQARLHELRRPAAIALVAKLEKESRLGFKNQGSSSGTLVDYAEKQKEKHPEKVLLIKVGEFYESFGIDALMLVEHAGLNPMGQRCRAGCPLQNLQPTLNDLTAAGLTVAVYEEIAPANTGSGPFKRLKQRALTQVVSPGSPVYMYEACLSPHEIAYVEPPPYVGICSTVSGYTAVQVFLDSRAWRVHRRLSRAALRSFLSSMPHAPPLLVDSTMGSLTFLPSDKRVLHAATPNNVEKVVLDLVAEQAQLSTDAFRQLSMHDHNRTQEGGLMAPRHLYTSTASQIGLLSSPGVPDLPSALLPPSAGSAAVQLLRRWLLLPPPPRIADAMRSVCENLMKLEHSLLVAKSVPVGKLVAFISARQGNTPLFLEIRTMLHTMQQALLRRELDPLNDALLKLVAFEAGLQVPLERLMEGVERAMASIDPVVVDPTSKDHSDPPSKCEYKQANDFFEKNEENFRNLVQPERVLGEYNRVSAAAQALSEALSEPIAKDKQLELHHDVINNALTFKRVKGKQASTEEQPAEADLLLRPAEDRHRKLLTGRKTTAKIVSATHEYLNACAEAHSAVRCQLQSLCDELQGELPTLVTTAHWTLLSKTLLDHVRCTMAKGWTLPVLRDAEDNTRQLKVDGIWPYWIPEQAAAKNSFTWNGIWMLTAPNMAGKSTLMRSTTVVALLANAGLLAPVQGGLVPRYDGYFVRTASFDVPSEGKSSFAQEMDDLHVLTSECGQRSLIMLDEIGRGTSTREGAALGVALLEWLDAKGMNAMFATHLHEIETLLSTMPPLPSLHRRCLRVSTDVDGQVKMHYALEEGVCTDSLALNSARNAGLPNELLTRMQELVDASPRVAAPREPSSDATASCAVVGHDSLREPDDSSPDEQLRKIGDLLVEVSGGHAYIHVPPKHEPPPRLGGRSCVYVLQYRYRHLKSGFPVYVGESDMVSNRLQQHRSRRRSTKLECVLVEVESKSRAREVEAIMISTLKAARLGRVTNIVTT